ncbi:hypothetical protein Tco_0400494 [Tanacetum coccineum]
MDSSSSRSGLVRSRNNSVKQKRSSEVPSQSYHFRCDSINILTALNLPSGFVNLGLDFAYSNTASQPDTILRNPTLNPHLLNEERDKLVVEYWIGKLGL